MTDVEADELLHPPRRWPPLSVLLAGALLLGPPLAGCGFALALRPWLEVVVPLVGLLVVARPAVNLLRGRREGVGGAVGVVALVGLLVGWGVVLDWSNGVPPSALLGRLVVGGWLVAVGGLAWWPETRRWCGLQPPADPDQ